MKGFTSCVLMVRPVVFYKNDETAANNYYQKRDLSRSVDEITLAAQNEFDALVVRLQSVGIEVVVHQDTIETITPDSVFPNNWISFHSKNKAILYPMYAPNRRLERNLEVIETLRKHGFLIDVIANYSPWEKELQYLEGTGSMVLDREAYVAYATISERTHSDLFIHFCKEQGFVPVVFHSYQSVGGKRLPIYHTNVMMSVGPTFAIIGLQTLDHLEERKKLIEKLEETGKEIIDLSEDQINQFAGNMLTLLGEEGPVLVMSSSAYYSLNTEQVMRLEKHAQLIHSPLSTIEYFGGGSARCMLAELF